MSYRPILLLWITSMVFTSSARAQDNGLIAVKLGQKAVQESQAADPQFYMAPELQVALEAQSPLAGFNQRDQVVLRVSPEAKGKVAMMESVEAVSVVSPQQDLKPMSLIVGYAAGQSKAVRESLERENFVILKQSERAKYFLVRAKNGNRAPITPTMIRALGTQVKQSGAVSATPDYPVRVPEPNAPRRLRRPRLIQPTETRPNDELYEYLWGMENIRAPLAWDVVRESPVIVAVIDTGVDINHPDLVDNLWTNSGEVPGDGMDNDNNGFVDDVQGWDFFSKDNSVFDGSEDDHGTHVAGTIGAVQNAIGVVGVSWKIQIMPVKFLGPNGGSTSDAIDSIYYAIDNGATVLNNSWGGGGYNPELEEAIEDANNKGVLFVAAAGNDANNNDAFPAYPASYTVPNVIAVAAIAEDESLASFSNYGAKSVDLAAPGVDILSTLPGADHGFYSGTSMATPHVSGALALMRGHPDFAKLPHSELRSTILNRTRPLPSLTGRCATGGTLDIGFLNGGTPPLPPQTGKVILASKRFKPGTVTLREGGGSIVQLELTLPAPAEVIVTANTSVQSNVPDNLVDTGLFSSSAPDGWDEALRFVSLPNVNSWVGVTLSHGTRLPAGRHTIEWDMFLGVEDSTVVLDGGSLSVIANVDDAAAPNQNQVQRLGVSRSPNRNVSSTTRKRSEQELRNLHHRTRLSKHRALQRQRARMLGTRGRMESFPVVGQQKAPPKR